MPETIKLKALDTGTVKEYEKNHAIRILKSDKLWQNDRRRNPSGKPLYERVIEETPKKNKEALKEKD